MIDEHDLTRIIDSVKDNSTSESETDFVLDRHEVIEVAPQEVIVAEESEEKSYEADFEYIRANIKDVINLGKDALTDMISIAKQSEHPRAFEVVATLMKALVDSNKDLLVAHKHNDERVVNKNNTTTNNVQNNTIFVGSTAEFSKMLKERREKEVKDDES